MMLFFTVSLGGCGGSHGSLSSNSSSKRRKQRTGRNTCFHEFSKNLTEALTSVIPEIRIFDPENAALPFTQASPLRPEITPILVESPSVILLHD